MIENSDRGITLNKGLAWTILVAIVSAVFWFGWTVSELTAASRNHAEAMSETRALIASERLSGTAVEARVRVLENSATRTDTRFDSLQSSLNEVKDNQRETNQLLRQLQASGN